MMVVLVIVGVLAALLVEGLGNALLFYQRVVDRQIDTYSDAIEIDWWRESIAAAAPNRWQRPYFQGTEHSLRFETFQPLLGEAGVATAVVWTIEQNRLRYRERLPTGELSQPIDIGVDERASFRFMDRDGLWYGRWPRHDRDLEIPVRVRLDGVDVPLEAFIFSHADPLIYIDEIEYGGVE